MINSFIKINIIRVQKINRISAYGISYKDKMFIK